MLFKPIRVPAPVSVDIQCYFYYFDSMYSLDDDCLRFFSLLPNSTVVARLLKQSDGL
jgi:hypothetical protein